MDLKERIREILRKEKFIKDPFGTPHKTETPSKNVKSDISTIGRPVIRERKTLRIPGLKSLKRIVSAFLFVNFLFMIFGMALQYSPSPGNDYILWIFVLGAWISLDYLWKTREKPTEAFK